jgi:hypothetical protein
MMATAFLGYLHSPKWYNLNLNLFLSSLYILSLFLILFSYVLFSLDNYTLSSVNFIKFIQIFSFILIPLYFLYKIYSPYEIVNLVSYINDNNDVHLHGHVSVDKETGMAIGQGISNMGSNIGLGASVAGVSAAMAKGISKSVMPPLQKAAVIGVGAVLGGGIHVVGSYINKGSASTTSNFVSNSNVNKFLPDSELSPLQGVL